MIRLYQNIAGDYLPDSIQPENTDDYNIVYSGEQQSVSTRYINVFIGFNGIPQIMKNGAMIDCRKTLPMLYEKKENCCGCTACAAICKTNAIQMLPDEEGFLYPVLDASKCVRCYKCITICPVKKKQSTREAKK